MDYNYGKEEKSNIDKNKHNNADLDFSFARFLFRWVSGSLFTTAKNTKNKCNSGKKVDNLDNTAMVSNCSTRFNKVVGFSRI